MAQKFYGVRKGRTPGVFEDYEEFQRSVYQFRGAQSRVFRTREQAESYVGPEILIAQERDKAGTGEALDLVAYTDGSYSEEDGRYGWGVFIREPTEDGGVEEVGFCGYGSSPDLLAQGSIAGETLAALKAMEYAVAAGWSHLTIRYDYLGVEKWISGEWAAGKPVSTRYVTNWKDRFEGRLQVTFEKVKGHSRNRGNDEADRLAAIGASGTIVEIGDPSAIYRDKKYLRSIELLSELSYEFGALGRKLRAAGPVPEEGAFEIQSALEPLVIKAGTLARMWNVSVADIPVPVSSAEVPKPGSTAAAGVPVPSDPEAHADSVDLSEDLPLPLEIPPLQIVSGASRLRPAEATAAAGARRSRRQFRSQKHPGGNASKETPARNQVSQETRETSKDSGASAPDNPPAAKVSRRKVDSAEHPKKTRVKATVKELAAEGASASEEEIAAAASEGRAPRSQKKRDAAARTQPGKGAPGTQSAAGKNSSREPTSLARFALRPENKSALKAVSRELGKTAAEVIEDILRRHLSRHGKSAVLFAPPDGTAQEAGRTAKLGVQLPVSLRSELAAYCERTNQPMSGLVDWLVRAFLEDEGHI